MCGLQANLDRFTIDLRSIAAGGRNTVKGDAATGDDRRGDAVGVCMKCRVVSCSAVVDVGSVDNDNAVLCSRNASPCRRHDLELERSTDLCRNIFRPDEEAAYRRYVLWACKLGKYGCTELRYLFARAVSQS